jgi:hypothetical protein
MKLAAIYNIWDSEELLIGSINQIREQVDEVIIVYQEYSNFKEYNPNLLPLLSTIDARLIKYTPDYVSGGTWNESVKRALGWKEAKRTGCTHFLFMDADEYYNTNDFLNAKQDIIDNDYDGTACRLYTYYKSTAYRVDPIENYYVPFICKIKEGQVIGGEWNVYCDPTRGISGVTNFYEFPQDKLMMHHLSYVRNDIGMKLRNSSAKANFRNIEGMIQRFNNWTFGEFAINFEQYNIIECRS